LAPVRSYSLFTVLPTAFKSDFRFSHSGFNLSASPQFNYGFSSLEFDKTVAGQGIRIKNVRDLTVHTHKGYPCCDVWVLLGPGPFGFQNGGVVGGQNPFSINPTSAVAPAQVRFVVVLAGLQVPFLCTETHELGMVASYLYQVQRPIRS
jgi:hypothetical protein